MKNYKRRLSLILVSMMLTILAGCGANNALTKVTQAPTATATESSVETTKEPSKADSDLQVHFLDVGQGDSILLVCDGKTMLIDAGDNAYGKGVVSYINDLGIKKIDYLIGTHPDADHIGGLDNVIQGLDIGKIFMPKQQSNTKTFEDVLTAISEKGLKINSPKVNDSFSLGSATVTILGPEKSYTDNNNNSIVIKVVHGENSFLFTGDAELEEEADLVESGVDLSATVLKAGHHGSSTSTSQDLLQAVNPTYAVISCGVGNKYGHPHTETLTYFKRAGVKVYRTDEQQTIIMTSDGTEITTKTGAKSIESTKTTSGSSGSSSTVSEKEETKATVAPTDTSVESNYIGNKNTKKYHKPTCGSLPAEKNRVSFSTKEEAEAAGYEGCQNCNP